jgi:hypothetical protein
VAPGLVGWWVTWSRPELRAYEGRIEKEADGTVRATITAAIGTNSWGSETKVEHSRVYTLKPGSRTLEVESRAKNVSGGALKVNWAAQSEYMLAHAAKIEAPEPDAAGSAAVLAVPAAGASVSPAPGVSAIRLTTGGVALMQACRMEGGAKIALAQPKDAPWLVLICTAEGVEIPAKEERAVMRYGLTLQPAP